MTPDIDPELMAVNAWEAEPTAEERITTEELVAALQREADAANSEYDRIRVYADLANRFYEGKPFGNEVDGRSQIVLPDVQETIDYMATSVLRPFVSGDKVVEFEATDESEEDAAQEATAAVSYNFMRQQDGYRILLDWTNCGMLERLGVAKTMMTTEERVIRETVQMDDPVQLETLTDADIEDVTESEDGTMIITIKSVKKIKRSTDEAVPLEEFRWCPRARHEDTADYLAHCPIKTRSALVDMGFDREQVYSLPAYTKLPDDRNDRYDADPESTDALQKIWLWEEYARIDIDGDGIAERIRVFRVENEILRWADGELAIETVDDQPFSIFCPFPRPHRIDGWSLADKVMDIQLARSTVARQLFDGMYNANMPRPIVSERGASENTIDDLLSPIAGAPIRVLDPAAVQAFQVNFDVGKSLTVMEWMTGERESRTGITRLNQGLDADALNKTASGTAMMQAQGQQQEEFIARNLGEAVSRLFAKKYRLMRTEGEPFKIKVDGKYKMVDPSTWPEDVNVNIRVGLGTGSKDKRIQARMLLAPLLAEGAAQGKVSDKQLFHAMDGLVRDLGIGQGDDFWKDPDAPVDPNQPQEQEQPDPEMLAMQAEQQREEAKMQFEQAKAQAQMQLDRERAEAQLALTQAANEANVQAQREKHMMDMQQAREKAQLEAQLARDKATTEAEIALYRIDREAGVKKYAADVGGSEGGDIGRNREGGDLDK